MTTSRPRERHPILVIDDEPEICRVVKNALGHDGVAFTSVPIIVLSARHDEADITPIYVFLL